ncbi:MAG TPA: MGMT family protein [Thermoanaerobaculia bacterium]|nr:MGMT family protein [Thermoanaerobaculia bacterium]
MRRRDGDGPGTTTASSLYCAIYRVVRRIPRGRVATYGQVARLAGHPGAARQVGYALHALPGGSDVPWHRVLNARGEISARSEEGPEHLQRALLEEEGVVFDLRGRCDLSRWCWRPRRPGEARRTKP